MGLLGATGRVLRGEGVGEWMEVEGVELGSMLCCEVPELVDLVRQSYSKWILDSRFQSLC